MRMIESLERRQLLAWSTYASLIGQDTLATLRSSLTGAGQTVAVLDTGVDYNHPILGGGFGKGKKVVAGYDFIQNDADPQDTDGHGTAVAGFIAGSEFTYEGKTYRGIAPDAKIVALRVGTGRSGILDDFTEQALQWVITNRTKYGITVVNISLGGGGYTTPFINPQLSDEFKMLKDLGVFVVAASGNDGTADVADPAADPNVFAAGSIDAADAISSFTQRCSLLDLLAPGEQVVSAERYGTGFTTVDGTSFASPIIAGAAALVRQLAPTLGVADVGSVLRTSSVANRDGDNESGALTSRVYGRLDLVAAMDLAEVRSAASLDAIATTKHTTIDTAYDASGVLHLAYYEPQTRKLMYTTRGDSSLWTTPVSVDTSGNEVGQHLSLALDQAGRPAIAYYDATNADLRYATLAQGTDWSTILIDQRKSVGQHPSLAFDMNGNPQIAYYSKSGGRLRFAAYDSNTTQWSAATIDGTSSDVGLHTSLDYFDDGFDGITAIAYADKANGDLKYARRSGVGEWETIVVDDLSGVASIDLTLNGGRARIAYQDMVNQDVKYAYKETNWFTQTVVGDGDVGRNIRSYVDQTDGYHIVYYSSTKGGTYDALIDEVEHAVASTDRVGTVGQTASVAVAADGSVTLVGLNRAGKQMYASELVDAV